MAEKTTPRGKRRTDSRVTSEQTAIEKARTDFLNGGAKRSPQRGARRQATTETGSKPEPRSLLVQAAARRPDIAERSAGGGRAFVDAMTESTKERGYRSWAELDVEEFRTLSDERRPEAIAHIVSNARDPLYVAALREVDPELAFAYLGNLSTAGEDAGRAQDASPPPTEGAHAANGPRPALEERVAANDSLARDAGRPELAANDSRAPLKDRAVANDPQSPPELSIDQSTLDRLAVQRTRDLEAARASLTQPSMASPAPQRPAAVTQANGIEPVLTQDVDERDSGAKALASTPVLAKDGYDIPAAILSRYVVKDGKYWQLDGRDKTPDTTGEPHFEDRGARLATPSDDRKTIADMIAVAHAKGWKEIALNGSEEFRRNAWIEASLAGIEAKGFKPTERDEAMLEASRREREGLSISAGKRDPQASAAGTAAPAPNEVVAREGVQQGVQSEPAKSIADVPVSELRMQAERAIARLPENVRRELMNRLAERTVGGMSAEREHARTGGAREALGPALDARLAKVDQDRVARQTPPAAAQNAPGRGRGVSDKDVPDASR